MAAKPSCPPQVAKLDAECQLTWVLLIPALVLGEGLDVAVGGLAPTDALDQRAHPLAQLPTAGRRIPAHRATRAHQKCARDGTAQPSWLVRTAVVPAPVLARGLRHATPRLEPVQQIVDRELQQVVHVRIKGVA